MRGMAAIQHIGERFCNITQNLGDFQGRRTLWPSQHPPARLRPIAASTPLLEPLPSLRHSKQVYPFIDPSFPELEQVKEVLDKKTALWAWQQHQKHN